MQRYDKSAQYVLVCLILGFVSVLSIGWGEMLSQAPTFFFFPPAGWAVAVLIALFAIFLARAVASERLRLKQTKDSAFRFAWLAYFVILLGISAVGTANFMYEKVFSDGSTARSQVLRDVEADFTKLQLSGQKLLSADRVREKVRQIRVLSLSLQKEILNPNRCGHGPEAKKYEQQIKEILGPHFAPTSGGEFMDSCSQQYANIYTEAVERGLETWTNAQEETKWESEFLPVFTKNIKKQVDALGLVIASESNSAFEPSYRAAVRSYNEIRLMLIQKFPPERHAELERTIPKPAMRDDHVADLKGNAYNKVRLIIQEASSGKGGPIAILFLALLADLFLVQAYGRHLYSLSREDEAEVSGGERASAGAAAIFKVLKRNRS
jgi:hypothetical protein